MSPGSSYVAHFEERKSLHWKPVKLLSLSTNIALDIQTVDNHVILHY